MTDTTHFGYETVDAADKAARVRDVFRSVASDYDIMNDLMSFGVHRLWKHFARGTLDIRPNHLVLDLAGGTGDLAIKISHAVKPNGRVVLADINDAMLAAGRDRSLDAGCNNIDITQVDAQCLPFPDNHFDRIIIGFGLRNVTDKAEALRSMYRVLKPGGRLVVLEFSKANLPGLKQLYDAYSFSLLPKLGKWVANDEDSYRYLAESIRMHPDQATLNQMLQTAGFDKTDYCNLSGGIVAVHRGFKF